MATEIEMKLTVPSHEVMDQILQDPQLTEHMQDEFEIRQMRSTYYDTADGALQTRRWTLRLRDEGGTRIVAMKTPNASEEKGFFTRREWQCRAERVEDAVERLVEQGAPEELKHLEESYPFAAPRDGDAYRMYPRPHAVPLRKLLDELFEPGRRPFGRVREPLRQIEKRRLDALLAKTLFDRLSSNG